MDPAMMGADPMAMAAGGDPAAEIMMAQGQPVDPGMAAAAGLDEKKVQQMIDDALKSQNGGAAPAGKGGGGKQEVMAMKLDSMASKLDVVVGVLMGKGLISEKDVGEGGTTGEQMPDMGQEAIHIQTICFMKLM